jgi:hypothetical protein
VFTIMLMGRWSSNAFLRYIRKQVKEFSHGVSSKMIRNENFFTIQNTVTNETRLSNNPVNHAQRFIDGPDFRDTIHPLVSIIH